MILLFVKLCDKTRIRIHKIGIILYRVSNSGFSWLKKPEPLKTWAIKINTDIHGNNRDWYKLPDGTKWARQTGLFMMQGTRLLSDRWVKIAGPGYGAVRAAVIPLVTSCCIRCEISQNHNFIAGLIYSCCY